MKLTWLDGFLDLVDGETFSAATQRRKNQFQLPRDRATDVLIAYRADTHVGLPGDDLANLECLGAT